MVNLACVWGLTQERGKEALCDEARKVVALAGMKRRSWRGIVDVVYGGEKLVKEGKDTKDKSSNRNQSRGNGNGIGVKRKADAETESNTEPQAPLSKRELKRRAKRAKLQGLSADDNSTVIPMHEGDKP